MHFHIEKDTKKCEELWDRYSTHRNIWDEWGVVHSLFLEKEDEPYFIVSDKGLLPLWYDKLDNSYYFYGGSYPEDKIFWFDLNYFDDFISQVKGDILLFYINEEEAKKIIDKFPQYNSYFKNEENHYFLNAEKLGYDIEKYLSTFNKKHRKNFLNDLKKFNEFNVSIQKSNMEYFDIFIKYNADRFGSESDFSEEIFTTKVRNLFNYLSEDNRLISVVVRHQDKIVGIEYGTIYKDIYYIINGGYDRSIKNMGKFLMFSQLKYAMETKAKIIDFLSSEPGTWKDLWNLEVEPYYDFRKFDK